MMAKNAGRHIGDAINELQKEDASPWELIIVDDHSLDNTFEIAKSFAENDNRIIVRKNIFSGKVLGTNFGFTLTNGDIIKCIDSDDILNVDFFREVDASIGYDAHYHDALIVDENLKTIAKQLIGSSFQNQSLECVVRNINSLPKAYWSYKREIAEKVFPLPESLPVEDEWISFSIKKYSKSILYIKKPLYLYRQHDGQDYGGILNYSLEKISFRAKRLSKVLEIVNEKLLQDKIDLSKEQTYLKLQFSKSSISRILASSLNFKQKIKLMLMLHAPRLTVAIVMIKWKLMEK